MTVNQKTREFNYNWFHMVHICCCVSDLTIKFYPSTNVTMWGSHESWHRLVHRLPFFFFFFTKLVQIFQLIINMNTFSINYKMGNSCLQTHFLSKEVMLLKRTVFFLNKIEIVLENAAFTFFVNCYLYVPYLSIRPFINFFPCTLKKLKCQKLMFTDTPLFHV